MSQSTEEKTLKALPIQYRQAEILTTRNEETGEETISISFSSETPVQRWFGYEILGHDTGEIDMERAEQGLAFIDNHQIMGSIRCQFGSVENIRLEDKKLRGDIKFSKRKEAQEIRQDMLDGILKFISVGYRVIEVKLIESKVVNGEDVDTYRVTRWMPYEVSTVSVPADITVGVNRSEKEEDFFPVNVIRNLAETNKQTTTAPEGYKENAKMENEIATAPAAVTVQVGAERSASDPSAIIELCVTHNVASRAADFIRQGFTTDQVARTILADAQKSMDLVRNSAVDLSEKEQKQYSLVRAISAHANKDWSRAGFEKELSQEIEGKLPSNYSRNNGFFMPLSVRAALSAGAATGAKETVFTEQGSFIELLRSRMFVRALGATMMSGLQGPVSFPKQTGAGSMQWLGESEAVAESNLVTGQVALNPRTLRGKQSYTKQLLAQASVDIENLVRRDLATGHALELDRASLASDGTSNSPTGVLYTPGVGVVSLGTNGGAVSYDSMVDLETAIAVANADVAAMAYVGTPELRGKLKKTAQLGNTAALPVWTGGVEGEVNGYKAYATNQLPKNLTKGSGTALHAALFGVWSDLMIGEWGILEIATDPFTRADNGEIVVRSFQMAGVAVRNPGSFAVIKDAVLS